MLRAFAFTLLALLAAISRAHCKSVFAHVIVGNNAAYTQTDWYNDIKAAAAALIDGFALNIGDNSFTDTQLGYAYSAAEQYGNGFQLFLSFDYGAVPDYDPNQIITRINAHSGSPAQYNYTTGKPLASTFEGPSHAADWTTIKAQTNCFFIPDYSSQGPTAAAAEPNVDGLLSWNAWPTGPTDMDNSTDTQYLTALAGKPYMMPVSPWFYSNLPQYSKNWLWRGDDLWHDRWTQVLDLQPELVEILTWNDWGESHYVGPNPTYQSGIPTGAAWYVDSVTHAAWLNDLPYYIQAYKTGSPPPPTQYTPHLTFWYRLNPASACADGGTVCDNAAYQTTYPPGQCDVDAVFFTVFTPGTASVSLQIGTAAPVTLTASSAGVFHSSVPFNGQTGPVVISATTSNGNGSVMGPVTGPDITTTCQSEGVNWNAWVGGS